MTIKRETILAIDRWSKYVWLAYCDVNSEVIFPLGYLLNDQMTFFNISEIIHTYTVRTIVIWRPSKQKDIQKKIKTFMQGLSYIIDTEQIKIEIQEEDYTSVQSGDLLSQTAKELGVIEEKWTSYKKNAAEDAVSAMIILKRWKNKQ